MHFYQYSTILEVEGGGAESETIAYSTESQKIWNSKMVATFLLDGSIKKVLLQ